MHTLTRPRIYLVAGAIFIFAVVAVYGLRVGTKHHASLGNQSASAATSPDINSDGTVNVFDLSILLAAWGTSATTSDLNSDGTVNVFDLSILLSKWGPVASPTPTPTPTPSGTPSGLPTTSSTGWQHTGVVLSACEQYASGGDYVIVGKAGGTVVDGCDFLNKQVVIKGGGPVTLKRSRVRNASNCDTACAAIYVDNGAGNVLIEDVEVTTTNPAVTDESLRQDRTIGINKNNTLPVTLNRVYAHDTTRGVDITGQNNITIQDSYLAFNVSPPPDGNCGTERKHSTAVRAAGGTYNVHINNTVLGVGDCAFASGIMAFYPENGANHDIYFNGGLWIIQGNNDGAYGIAVGYTPSAGESQNYNFSVIDTMISTQYYAEGCPSGCGQNWDQNVGSPVGPVGGTKVWQNVTKYDPGKPDNGQPIGP